MKKEENTLYHAVKNMMAIQQDFLRKKPENITENIHYFRNKLNIEYEWKDFEKLNNRLPEGYKWKILGFPADLMHQNTAPNTTTMRNKKYVSADGYFEAVYSYDGKLLNEGVADIDMGTYNYAPSEKGFFKHYGKDMITYNFLKNTKTDFKNFTNGEGVY